MKHVVRLTYLGALGGAAVLLLFSTTSCSGGYHAGSFESPHSLISLSARPDFFGERTTVGCLDVAIARYADALAEGAAVQFSIANRCNQRTAVDFRRLIVFTASGEQLIAFDPRGELKAVHLGARRVATETIDFRPSSGARGENLGSVCVDLSSFTPQNRANGRLGNRRTVCLGQTTLAAQSGKESLR